MSSDSKISGQVGRVRDTFAVAYFNWALRDAEKQSMKGFPLLGLLRDGLAREYVRFWAALSEQARRVFVSGMVKRFHRRAVALTGMAMTPEENALVARHLNCPPSPNTQEEFCRPRPTVGDLRKLRAIVKSLVDEETGGKAESWTPGHIVFHRSVKRWTVSTSITVHTKIYLSYDHSIRDNEGNVVEERISVSNWLGIGGQTTWMLMKPGELEESARSAMALARYFLDQIPEILASVVL
jgi:hypothetical protein